MSTGQTKAFRKVPLSAAARLWEREKGMGREMKWNSLMRLRRCCWKPPSREHQSALAPADPRRRTGDPGTQPAKPPLEMVATWLGACSGQSFFVQLSRLAFLSRVFALIASHLQRLVSFSTTLALHLSRYRCRLNCGHQRRCRF